MLLKICDDIGIDVKGKKTEELVNLLFTNGVPGLHVTPVVNQNSVFTGVLPKKTARTWMHCPLLINVTTPVCLILNFPVQHFWLLTTLLLLDPVLHARGVQNFKGMDRAIRYFEAGDVQDIQISQV